MADYQVFLSYNSRDREVVQQLNDALLGRGIRVWFDEDRMPPGSPIREVIETGIRSSDVVAICIGANGLGNFERLEFDMAFNALAERQVRIIPILLPGSPADLQIPDSLRVTSYISFRHGVDDPKLLDRLEWGITGQRPVARPASERRVAFADTAFAGTAANPAEVGDRARDDPIETAIERLADSLLSTGVGRSTKATFVLGCHASGVGPDYPPRSWEITKDLLVQLKLIDEGYDQLLPTLDRAGVYYEVREGGRGLEDRVADLIARRSTAIPPTHEKLAAVLRQLTSRSAHNQPELIVTTNIDILMEKALLAAGVPFTRIVQHRSTLQLDVNEYSSVGRTTDGRILILTADGQASPPAAPDDELALARLIAEHGRSVVKYNAGGRGEEGPNPLNRFTVPASTPLILYKYHGSHDVAGSCTITSDHYLLQNGGLRVPAQIIQYIAERAVLFLGCGPLDAEFRHLYYTLIRPVFRDSGDPSRRYAVLNPLPQDTPDPYVRMAARVWPNLRDFFLQEVGVRVIEAVDAEFLDRLLARLANRERRAA